MKLMIFDLWLSVLVITDLQSRISTVYLIDSITVCVWPCAAFRVQCIQALLRCTGQQNGIAVRPKQKAGFDQPVNPPQCPNLVSFSHEKINVPNFSTALVTSLKATLSQHPSMCTCALTAVISVPSHPSQCGLLHGRFRLVHGLGIWAVHSADIHVRECHGVHHGGGALSSWGEGTGHGQRVCSS